MPNHLPVPRPGDELNDLSQRHELAALSQLSEQVVRASSGARADLDQRYLLTAFVVHRGPPHEAQAPVVVELLDHGPSLGLARWQAMAHDELSGAATQLGHGATAEQALASLDWESLDPRASCGEAG